MKPPHRDPRVLVGGLALLAASGVVLAAWPDAALFYIFNVLVHPALGLGWGVAGAAWVWRRWGAPAGSARGEAAGPMLTAGVAASAVGLLFGTAVLVTGATRPWALLLGLHVAASSAGALLIAAHVWRAVGGDPLRRWAIRGGIALLALAGALTPAMRDRHDAGWRAGYVIENPPLPPASMEAEGAGADSPFFPSSARTNTGDLIPADFFLTSEMCGRCHSDIYDQWNESAHHFASFNNQWYRRSIEYMQDVVGTEPSKWCAGCHDHAMFFNGRFDRPAREQIDTPEAQAGLGCTSCHSIVHVGGTMGQGDFIIEYPALHDLAASELPPIRWAHDLVTELAPEPHRRTFLKPFHTDQEADFCSSCHKVHLDAPVNHYRWIRGFNEYDNWQASGVSGEGARSFYYPETPQTCNSCHMPLVPSDDPAADDGLVRSHRFPGANTALPFVNGHDEQLRTVREFLRAGQVTIDIFGVARVAEPAAPPARARRAAEPTLSSTFAVGEESASFGARMGVAVPEAVVTAPLDARPVGVRRGESVRVEVVVRTRNVGHFFPGGTVDAFDVWVEFEAVDDSGRVLLHSGEAADGGSGPVDPSAHFYRSLQLDGRGNPINKRNAWMTRSVAYVRLIPPGAADTIHYRLHVPPDAGERIQLRAKVNYRKFAWYNTQWAYAGVRDPDAPPPSPDHDDAEWTFTGDTSNVSGGIKAIPDIPTTVMAEAEAALHVVDADAPLPETLPVVEAGDVEDLDRAGVRAAAPGVAASPSRSALRGRWNDYGIGLLLQGDLRGAEGAFREVMGVAPEWGEGPFNVARVHLEEGEVELALPLLDEAMRLGIPPARTGYFRGVALRALGRYDEALAAFEEARAVYPRDRVVLNEIGRLHFLERRYDEAVSTLESVLRIDPEDLQAHYTMMLAYRGAQRMEEAAEAQARYERFTADESAQAITGPFRRASPEDNNERQLIHEH